MRTVVLVVLAAWLPHPPLEAAMGTHHGPTPGMLDLSVTDTRPGLWPGFLPPCMALILTKCSPGFPGFFSPSKTHPVLHSTHVRTVSSFPAVSSSPGVAHSSKQLCRCVSLDPTPLHHLSARLLSSHCLNSQAWLFQHRDFPEVGRWGNALGTHTLHLVALGAYLTVTAIVLRKGISSVPVQLS